MKNKLVAGFMAATMMVSVMSTGVFAKELNPDSETNKAGDTQVTATVEENVRLQCRFIQEIYRIRKMYLWIQWGISASKRHIM